MEQKNFIAVSSFLILIILFVNLISAFGIASPYWKGNPLMLYPGQTNTVSLNLQNMGTTEDVRVRVDLVQGNEIATLEKNEYLVKAGTKDTAVLVDVAIPAGAVVGTIYNLKLTTKTITPGGTGVVFGTGMDTSFDVEVVGKPAPQPTPVAEQEKPVVNQGNNLIWLIVIIIAVVIIIYFLMQKGKKVKKIKRR